MRNITFTPGAYKDYIEWLKTDKKLFVKISGLIREIAKTPFEGTGKPEALKHELTGTWSRTINNEHRLVYSVSDLEIKIIACKYHYK